MRATIGLARELFQQFATHELWYFIPYRLCQDALEHFFGDIRARNGWCNNPTALQFMFSYRALLSNRFHLQGLSGGRNCIELVDDGDDVLPVDDDDGLLQSVADDTEKKCSAELLNQLFATSQPTLGKLNVIYYMAGWSARSVARQIKCVDCRDAMFMDEPFDAGIGRLTLLKQRNGLMYASRSVYRVAFLAYQSLQLVLPKTSGKPPTDRLLLPKLVNSVIAAVVEARLVFTELRKHDAGSLLDAHLPKMVKGITSKIIRAFLGHISRTHNEVVMGAASNKRNQATRLTIFKGL